MTIGRFLVKITFLCPEISQGGGSRVIAIYAGKLLEMGHDVTVVSRQPKPVSWQRRLLDRLQGRPVPGDPKARTVHFDFLGDRHRWLPWKWPVDVGDVPDGDILIATWWRTAFEVAMMPPEKGAKAYFIQHHEVHDHLPQDLSSGSYRLPLQKITIADWLVDTMAKVYGDTNVVKVENSVDTDLFIAPPRERNARPRVGFLYSKSTFKGVDISLTAIEIARQRFPDLQVMAFGTTPPVDALPLPKGTEYHLDPAQSRLRDLYASCDVWLCGSRAEGFHLPPLEAMACRTPVVATRVGGAVEAVTEGVNGHLVEIEDSATLGARLIDVLSLVPEDWRAMSDAAYARAHAYTWDTAAAEFEAALVEIAGKARA